MDKILLAEDDLAQQHTPANRAQAAPVELVVEEKK
jgi:hypothetical protein